MPRNLTTKEKGTDFFKITNYNYTLKEKCFLVYIKTFPQRKIPTQMASLVISTTYIKNTFCSNFFTHDVQTFPEYLKGENTFQHIL